jgi:hypothetical protein
LAAPVTTATFSSTRPMAAIVLHYVSARLASGCTSSVTGWRLCTRLVRGETLGVKRRDFAQTARANGTGDARIILYAPDRVVAHRLSRPRQIRRRLSGTRWSSGRPLGLPSHAGAGFLVVLGVTRRDDRQC